MVNYDVCLKYALKCHNQILFLKNKIRLMDLPAFQQLARCVCGFYGAYNRRRVCGARNCYGLVCQASAFIIVGAQTIGFQGEESCVVRLVITSRCGEAAFQISDCHRHSVTTG